MVKGMAREEAEAGLVPWLFFGNMVALLRMSFKHIFMSISLGAFILLVASIEQECISDYLLFLIVKIPHQELHLFIRNYNFCVWLLRCK